MRSSSAGDVGQLIMGAQGSVLRQASRWCWPAARLPSGSIRLSPARWSGSSTATCFRRAPVMTALRDLTEDNPANLRFDPGATRFGSVWRMTPANPLLQAFAAIPVSPTVAAHSIIAVQGDGPVETGDDGVVTYQSAHIPEAVSELVVRAGHSVQSESQTVREVRRIVLLRLAEACP